MDFFFNCVRIDEGNSGYEGDMSFIDVIIDTIPCLINVRGQDEEILFNTSHTILAICEIIGKISANSRIQVRMCVNIHLHG